jgi:hypothetical protein
MARTDEEKVTEAKAVFAQPDLSAAEKYWRVHDIIHSWSDRDVRALVASL